jgi:hypothetical protein
MNKLFCGLLMSLFMGVGANAQTVEGSWQGTIKANDEELRVRLHVTKDVKGTLKATWDSIDQGIVWWSTSHPRRFRYTRAT